MAKVAAKRQSSQAKVVPLPVRPTAIAPLELPPQAAKYPELRYIGDLDAIIDAKRHDTSLLFVTDGTTWKARLSDLKKIVQRQNQGKIARIYTTKMAAQLREDLLTLKSELRILL